MKYTSKIVSIFLLVILIFALTACNDNATKLLHSETINADSYINYSEEVSFDYEIHPELIDNGLFWMMYDEDAGKVVGVNVNDEAKIAELGAALVDPSKPTLINIHGVQLGTYDWTDAFSSIYNANTTVLPPEVYGYEGKVNMNQIWLDRGWNVMNFMYHRFADELIAVNKIFSNKIIEAKNWGIDGPQKMRYRLRDGSFSVNYDEDGEVKGEIKYPELMYSVTEYFVADYIRAFNSVEGLANNEIRIACHSMGNTILVPGAFLLKELIRVGQIPKSLMPDRLAILDGYIGVPGADNNSANAMTVNNDMTIRWTGKPVSQIGTTEAFLDCLKQLVIDYNMPVEYYIDKNGTVPQAGGSWLNYVKEYCAVSYFDMNFAGMSKMPGTDHNSIREMYHSSYAAQNPPIDITNEGVIAYAMSAKSSIEDIINRRGFEYLLVEGKSSGHADDHAFIRVR